MTENNQNRLLEKGAVLNGKWEILGHIASGGKGAVYRATQKNLDRQVAIKVILPEFLETLEDDEEDLQAELGRFRREVQAMAQTRHPNILQVYDYDRVEIDSGDLEYIVMEYIPGATLRLTMPETGFRRDEAGLRQWLSDYFFPILDGVEAIHAIGIIHRDLKPENVLMDGDVPKIADFGLAGGKIWEPITRSHHALGTIIYMAPEQFSDMELTDARADVYALGKIFYEAVAGKMEKGTAFPLQTAALPDPDSNYLKQLDSIIQQATAKDPSRRIPSALEFKRILERTIIRPASHAESLSGAQPVQTVAPRKAPVILAAVLAVLLMAGVWYHFNGFPGFREPEVGPEIHRVNSPERGPDQMPGIDQVPREAGAKYTSVDRASFRYVPGGEFELLDESNPEAGRPVSVTPFFMEENEVTNHQFVEFLNSRLSDIAVKDNVVTADDVIWFFLGEISDGYEPIVFSDGKFKVNGPENAANPVVRVTAHGAEAFASYYGRRLPSVNEWLHAAGTRHFQNGSGGIEAGNTADRGRPAADAFSIMHGAPALPEGFRTSPSPVGRTAANEFGVIGLDANVSEWAVERSLRAASSRYFIMGGLGAGQAEPSSKAIARYSWEAFGTVGFRTVIPAGE